MTINQTQGEVVTLTGKSLVISGSGHDFTPASGTRERPRMHYLFFVGAPLAGARFWGCASTIAP
jgi:hypothetical protein